MSELDHCFISGDLLNVTVKFCIYRHLDLPSDHVSYYGDVGNTGKLRKRDIYLVEKVFIYLATSWSHNLL